jgi:1,4-dihydroxy-2-naphthoyl-CoA hydrolase
MSPPATDATEFGPSGFAEEIGVEWIDLDPEGAHARIVVEPRHLQPNGVVHGGVYASLAESLASAATYDAVKENGEIAFGMANNTSFLRVISEGHVNATASARQRGRTTWVWDVEMTDDEGRLCALSRMTVAVRPAR